MHSWRMPLACRAGNLADARPARKRVEKILATARTSARATSVLSEGVQEEFSKRRGVRIHRNRGVHLPAKHLRRAARFGWMPPDFDGHRRGGHHRRLN